MKLRTLGIIAAVIAAAILVAATLYVLSFNRTDRRGQRHVNCGTMPMPLCKVHPSCEWVYFDPCPPVPDGMAQCLAIASWQCRNR